jgi:uncharacterized RDD family membrane protein YckC
MQTIRVRTTQNVFIHYPLASIGDRIGAYLIDRIALVLYCVAVVVALINLSIELWWVYMILVGFPFIFYSLLFEIFMDGQTPGKRLVKIKVVRLDGTQPSIGDYLFRWLFSFIDFLFSGAVAVIIMAINGKGQRLGDIVAGTSVVKLIEQQEITANDIFITPEEAYQPVFSQVTQLSEKDIEVIQRALETARRQGNMQPAALVSDRIRSLLGIQTDLAPTEFLYAVIKDFNHLTSRV